MPVAIQEVSAEVSPAPAEPPPAPPPASSAMSGETERRHFQDWLDRLAQRRARLQAD